MSSILAPLHVSRATLTCGGAGGGRGMIEAIRSEYRSTREGISALHEAVGHIELDNSPVVKKLVDAIARMNVLRLVHERGQF